MSKQSLLDAIAVDIISTKVCLKLAAQATQLVMGSGNPDADIVFIGEAPGRKEDECGEPFMGASGKMLDKMLDSIHLKRSQVYITNIVKYRPPKNRDPLKSEKAEFTQYLERQLEVINPKIIVTLGRHSGEYFIPDLKISRDHGQPMRAVSFQSPSGGNSKASAVEPVILLPLYHPAAALYNGKLRSTLMFDFQKIPIILKKQHRGL